MNTSVWVSDAEFNDDSKVRFSKNDITVFVGPNNAGKSGSLKEIASLLRQRKNKHLILKDITIERVGDETDIISFMELISRKYFQNDPEPHYQGLGYSVYAPNIKTYWSHYKDGLNELFSVFVNMLSTEARLSSANPPASIKLTKESPQHPIHFLQKDDEIERKFSDYFRQAFGTDLMVHRNAGNEVPLYIGERPLPSPGEDRVSRSYLDKLEKLDLLHLQGDGMRSFIGVILNTFISDYSILLIDEPEAFLHPPQARLLGKMLAKDLPSGRQLFLATHSEDFLKGLLDADNSNLKIIRIQREDLINKVSVLDSSDIKNIWGDPILRHSNVLNGLFHSKVIICESDSDCRFYSAIISSIYESVGTVSPDMLFIHCGGKHRIPTVAKSLMKLDVDVRVIVDFDVLSDENPLKLIYSELGGVWNEIEDDWQLVKTSIDQKRPELETQDLKKEIDDIFTLTNERIFPKNRVSDIQKLLSKASSWAHAKELGSSFIPNGDATKAYERVRIKLMNIGFHIVEVGELESFDRSVGNHGPKWVNEVLKKDLISDPHLESARQFIQQVIN